MATTTTANGVAAEQRRASLGQDAGSGPRLVVLALLPLIGGKTGLISNYGFLQLSLMIVYAIAVLGLNLLTGFNGQISLGHGAFFAVGAYTAAILIDQLRTGPTGRRCRSRRSSASSSATCSACRRCGSRATIWRSPPSRWPSRCRRS